MFYNNFTGQQNFMMAGGAYIVEENKKENQKEISEYPFEADYSNMIISMVSEISNQEYLRRIYSFVKVKYEKEKRDL